jgi:hypothetical protein
VVLDDLELLGSGTVGQVRGSGQVAVKVAHAGRTSLLVHEIQHLLRLQSRLWGVAVPRLLAWRFDKTAYARQRIDGFPLHAKSPLHVLRAALAMLRAVHSYRDAWGVMLDFSPANILVTEVGPVLLDAGPRRSPSPFRGVTTLGELVAALERYRLWRLHAAAARMIKPLPLPPSGRFHVDVPVGPVAQARLLWVNQPLMQALHLSLSDGQICAAFNLGTHARTKTQVCAATRYQDSPHISGARGDGRSLYVGQLEGGPYGRYEVMLKGCGRTPLAWKGHKYHQDGYVSFPRTLWETTIADELARLGFETPQTLAVLSTGKTTVDNTRKRWPAAVAVRVGATQLRLGHLHRWKHRRSELLGMLVHVGRVTWRPDFDPLKLAHLLALLTRFAENLGWNTGRTDVLNIHGFNPTLGNVRVDGHFIDFSTVRFFRSYMPDFRYLNLEKPVKTHRSQWRLFVRHFVDVLRGAHLITPPQAKRALTSALRAWDQRYDQGYVSGLNCFLGFPEPWESRLSGGARRHLVAATQRLRLLRANATVDFPSWQQRCRAPFFGVESQMPAFIRAWQTGSPAPWVALHSECVSASTKESQRIGKRFFAALSSCVGTNERNAAQPCIWEQVVRPGMEAESLARLCYRQSTPRRQRAWSAFVATSRHLARGTWSYLDARIQAKRLGHIMAPGILPYHYEYVVGVTAELETQIVEVCRRLVGGALVGLVVHGSRVMTRERVLVVEGTRLPRKRTDGLREFGPVLGRSSDLDMKVFVKGSLSAGQQEHLTVALGAELARLGAWFPLVSHQPPRQRLIPTAYADVRRAFLHYNGAPRMRMQGRPPIPLCQCVVLGESGEEVLDACADAVDCHQNPAAVPVDISRIAGAKGGTRCVLDKHMLEMVLRDSPWLEPPPLVGIPHGEGRWEITDGAEAMYAAAAAGRNTVPVIPRT